MNKSDTSNIYKWAKYTPSAIALVTENGDVSYLLLAQYIAKFIKTFEKMGIRKGMFIGLEINSNDVRELELFISLALDALGAIRVCKLVDNDIIEYCDFIFTITKFSLTPKHAKVIYVTTNWINEILQSPISDENLEILNSQPDPDQPFFLGATSGTTGRSKYFLVSSSVRNASLTFVESKWMLADIKNYLAIWDNMGSLGNSYFGCALVFRRGGTIIFSGLHRFFQDINSYPNSFTGLIMKDVHLLMRKHPEGDGNKKLSNMRVLGSHLTEKARIWLEDKVAKRVINTYSSSESGQIAEKQVNGDCKIYPGVKVRIVDENWCDLKHGEIGQITISSPIQISGYVGPAELNRLYFKNGWFRSNDLGYLKNCNTLVLLDRVDNMLNLGGNKYSPTQIEDEIKSMIGIDNCVLIEDVSTGDNEAIAICIETSQKVNIEELKKLVASIFDKKTTPYHFYSFKSLPKTETGKIQRNMLKKLLPNAIHIK